MNTISLDFLQHIYSQQCEDGDYIVLSVKGPDIKWKDVPIEYGPSLRKDLEEFFHKYPKNKYDLYWSPMPYSQPNKRLTSALDTKFMAQDIDEHDDPNQLDPAPSYIWESSPNKYQGLWELDRYIEEPEYTPLNKALAKHIGCDDCFDFSHVYRIPGTINHKYKNKPHVGLPQGSNKIYKPKTLRKIVGAQPTKERSVDSTEVDGLAEREIYAKYSIPQKVRNLLALRDLTGVDRSSTIWYIENTLYDLGMAPGEIILLVKNSTFNKYKGRSDEDKRLRNELMKIISGKVQEASQDVDQTFRVSTFGEVMADTSSFAGWLVKGFWGRRSHGIVAGMPKCFKSTLVHDLAISVAGNRPFLGRFPVEESGPVIVIQNENADYIMRDRTEKILLNRGLVGKVDVSNDHALNIEFHKELPIYFINQQGFIISNPEHQRALEKLISEVKPVLIIFDPLYLMFDGDLNSAQDLNPALNWLLYLKNEYRTSVMVIHHYNKGGAGAIKGGARMMGSIILYGWVESAWYLTKEDDDEDNSQIDIDVTQQKTEPTVVTLSREFRMASSFPDVDIHLTMGELGDPHYDVDVVPAGKNVVSKAAIKKDILNMLTMTNASVTSAKVAEGLGMDHKQIRGILEEMAADKSILSTSKGFSIYKGKK